MYLKNYKHSFGKILILGIWKFKLFEIAFYEQKPLYLIDLLC